MTGGILGVYSSGHKAPPTGGGRVPTACKQLSDWLLVVDIERERRSLTILMGHVAAIKVEVTLYISVVLATYNTGVDIM